MIELDIKPHTVIMLIGPSNCGKTYFAENVLIKQLKILVPLENTQAINIQHISSDNIRRDILGYNYGKYSENMGPVSSAAFDILYSKLKAVTQFPVNAEFVIVDTKGTNENFRNEIIDISRKNNYNILPIMFSYRNTEDYFSDDTLPMNVKKSIKNDLKKIHTEIRRSLKLKNIKNLFVIRDKDFDKYDITCKNHELLRKCFVNNEREITVISDVHGCYNEFIELLNKIGIKTEGSKIKQNIYNKFLILNGDYVDKGPDTLKMIDFCHDNLNDIKIVIGNHENRLYKELFCDLKHEDAFYSTSYDELLNNEESRNKFKFIFENSLPFIMNDKCIITHAPCNIMYAGKIDNVSLRNQRYYAYNYENKTLIDMFNEDLKLTDNDICTMKHIFGHVQTSTPANNIKGRILIDGGCSSGYRLCSLTISNSGRTFSDSVQSTIIKTENLLPYKYVRKENEDEKADLSYKEMSRIKYLADHKVNFISGTMSPTDKSHDDLESISTAIEYFKSKKVYEVVMQPKYMGSRCNIYITNDNETSYAVSRQGYIIDRIDLSDVFDNLREKLKAYYDFENEVQMIIVDGELLPWKALGNGLIHDFKLINENINHELKFLESSGFEQKYFELEGAYRNTDFDIDENHSNKKEMIKKYGNGTYETFKCYKSFKDEYIPIKHKKRLNSIYKTQLDLYASDAELEYKGFSILKVINYDNSEECYYLNKESTMTNSKMFEIVNQECRVYNLADDNDVLELIKQFCNYISKDHFEGVVMKPEDIHSHCVPYLKIRNSDYLTITYGYDYTQHKKYAKLLERKGIQNKLQKSEKQFNIGLNLLSVKHSDIDMKNKDYLSNCIKMTIEEKSQEKLDPRL